MKNIIIVGATGFIGQHLLNHYLGEGAKVLAIAPDVEKLSHISSKQLMTKKATFDEFESINFGDYFESIDIVYYLAWGGYGKATNDYKEQIKNIRPLCDIIVAASNVACKRVVFSTSFSEYMISENTNMTHNDGAYCNVYGSAKHSARLMAQAVAAQKGVPFVSVAFANTFGPGDSSKRSTNLFIHKLLNGEELALTKGQHLYDWNYIDDTLEGLVLAGENGKSDSVYYIGNNERRPLKDIVTQVRDIVAPDVGICFGAYKEDFYVDYSCVDVHKLYRETGYLAKTDFKEAIEKTVEWVKTLKWE